MERYAETLWAAHRARVVRQDVFHVGWCIFKYGGQLLKGSGSYDPRLNHFIVLLDMGAPLVEGEGDEENAEAYHATQGYLLDRTVEQGDGGIDAKACSLG